MNLAFDGQNLRGCTGTQSLLKGKACCEVTETSPKHVCHSVSRILLGAAMVDSGCHSCELCVSVTGPNLPLHLPCLPVSLYLLTHFLLISPCSSFLYCYLYSSLSSFAHDSLRGPSCPEFTSHPPSAQLLGLKDHYVSR